ncbi:MAG TPA: LytR family transcriptional regulator [Treponema sp.]|nr:LytR family transcriptional regulator [Treponema sp.]
MNVSRERVSAIFIIFILLIMIVAGVMIGLSLRTDPVAEALKNNQVVTTLVVLNDGSGNALATDVFVYASNTQRGVLFDILGNTGQIYKKSLGRVDRIDAIYREKGVDVYREEISALLDLPIPFTLEITLDDFGRLTDLLGGLKVFVPSPVDYEGDGGVRWLLPSGAVTLDGDKIQTYVRYLLPEETDAEQEDRRQNAVSAFLGALKDNRGVVLDKKNFPVFAGMMTANIGGDNLYRLMELISAVDSESLMSQSITGTLRVVDGKTLLFPFFDGQLIKDEVKQKTLMIVSSDGQIPARAYVVEILNGTTKQGLAHNAMILLQSSFKILQTGNASRNDYEHTEIIDHLGSDVAARSLGDFIRCYNITEEPSDAERSGDVDFTLILGADWDGRYVRGGYGKKTEEELSAGQDGSGAAAGSGPEKAPEMLPAR